MKKILVIEDDPQLSQLIRQRLEAEGYQVIAAADGATGLDRAQKENPDLITLDIMLPELNGFTVCSVLKSRSESRGIPLIILSSRGDAVDKSFDNSVKPEAYITKPFDSKDLVATIKRLLGP